MDSRVKTVPKGQSQLISHVKSESWVSCSQSTRYIDLELAYRNSVLVFKAFLSTVQTREALLPSVKAVIS